MKKKENYIKVAFLYNFSRLTTWPDKAFKKSDDPIHICLMGYDSLGDALHRLSKKKVKNRRLYIQHNVTLKTLSSCHILLIDKSEQNKLPEIIQSLKTHNILTVSEIQGFAQRGGHIRLFINNKNTYSLEINLERINQAHLKVSSHILSLATIVSSKEKT